GALPPRHASGGGPARAFNLTAGAPAATVGTGPTGTVANPPTVTWQAVADAVTYTLRIDDLTTGANYVVFQTGLTGTRVSVPGLTSGHTYRAWMYAANGFGLSPLSNAVVFTPA